MKLLGDCVMCAVLVLSQCGSIVLGNRLLINNNSPDLKFMGSVETSLRVFLQSTFVITKELAPVTTSLIRPPAHYHHLRRSLNTFWSAPDGFDCTDLVLFSERPPEPRQFERARQDAHHAGQQDAHDQLAGHAR